MAGNIFLEHVVPILGVASAAQFAGGFVATALFLSSYPAVQAARLNGNIGDLNPLPFVFIVANCMSWTCYSFVTRDVYVFVPNCIGLLIGAYFTLTAYGLIRDQLVREKVVSLAMPLMALLLIIAAVDNFHFHGGSRAVMRSKELLWGYTANAILLCFYSSPLSTVAHVIKLKDSSSLTLPLCIMNIINGALWLMYGLAIGDSFIWVPNGIGALLGAFQTTLCLVYTRKNVPIRSMFPGSDRSAMEVQ